ncbi:hypothetical protein M0R45_030577 [Rubus argutus]|uniref:EF-hand domain-containing protein n=1 Tax=Rubus argutus TaxID=59490 RepID=A0AAW1WBU3_RUBAR
MSGYPTTSARLRLRQRASTRQTLRRFSSVRRTSSRRQHQPPPHQHQASPYGAPSAPYAAPPPHGSSGGRRLRGSVRGSSSRRRRRIPGAGSGLRKPLRGSGAVVFPARTDPNVVACFQIADQDGSGFIDDKELQKALSSYNQSFSLRTVHLSWPKEFTAVFYSLQNWRGIFEKFDRDRSGKIDSTELRDALASLGFTVSPVVLDLLVSKFDKTGGHMKAIEYDNFIECCLTVKGLTEKFKEKDKAYTGHATFSYEDFMLVVLPFLIA